MCVDIHTVWVEPYRPYSPTAMMTAVHRKASNNLTRKFHQILSLSIRIHGRFVSMYRARYVVSSGGCISRAYAWCFQFTFDMSAFNVMWLDFHGQPWSRLQAGWEPRLPPRMLAHLFISCSAREKKGVMGPKHPLEKVY